MPGPAFHLAISQTQIAIRTNSLIHTRFLNYMYGCTYCGGNEEKKRRILSFFFFFILAIPLCVCVFFSSFLFESKNFLLHHSPELINNDLPSHLSCGVYNEKRTRLYFNLAGQTSQSSREMVVGRQKKNGKKSCPFSVCC